MRTEPITLFLRINKWDRKTGRKKGNKIMKKLIAVLAALLMLMTAAAAEDGPLSGGWTPSADPAVTEELQALFDSRDIDLTTLEEATLDNASYFGRIFARSGGLSDAVAEALKEQQLDEFELKACTCDGIEECKAALMRKSRNALDANFIEGMACISGCIGGAGNLTHGEKNKAAVDQYGHEALEKTIADAVSMLK